jgi:hypothetical protein
MTGIPAAIRNLQASAMLSDKTAIMITIKSVKIKNTACDFSIYTQ